MRFGLFGNVAANGCGAIALYNVLLASGIELTLGEIIRGLRLRLGLPFGGICGANCFIVAAYLGHWLKLRLRFLFLGDLSAYSQCDSVIIMYYWRRKFKLGAHYICGIRAEDGCFDFYNYSANVCHSNLQDFLTAMRGRHELPIFAIGCLGLKCARVG